MSYNFTIIISMFYRSRGRVGLNVAWVKCCFANKLLVEKSLLINIGEERLPTNPQISAKLAMFSLSYGNKTILGTSFLG